MDYQDGVITEHSIGFQTINDKIEVREDGTQDRRRRRVRDNSTDPW